MAGLTRAVVLGSSVAGMLVSSVLARHFDDVVVVDRGDFSARPEVRKEVPQGRHAHLLWSGGARAVESLVPGIMERLIDAGALRIGVPEDQVLLSAYGWQQRFPATQFLIACSRGLFDWVLKSRTLDAMAITLLANTAAVGVIGGPSGITGVLIRSHESDSVRRLDADLVVDAMGRGSQLRTWLRQSGVPPVREDTVDCGLVYATRVFRAPAAMKKFPMVFVSADHRASLPGRNGVLLPIEWGRWMVTLSGTRGDEPPGNDEGFVEYARGLRHPVIGDLVATAENVSDVHRSRSTINRRMRLKERSQWPSGLLVVGDAFATLNPIYGHGMSLIARSAVVLDEELRRHGPGANVIARVQRRIDEVVDDAWVLATSQDVCYPDCRIDTSDPRLTREAEQRRNFADVLGSVALSDPVVAAAVTQVSTLSAPLSSVEAPKIIAALRRPSARRPPAGPTLTAEELTAIESVGGRQGGSR